jgi:hypothetical protein
MPLSMDGLKTIVYVGKSMYPLLRDLDTLYFIPFTGQPLNAGDVIVFRAATGHGTNTTHRIVSITPGGCVTRGDNNNSSDDGLVTPDDIIGLVAYAKRGNKLIKTYGGFRGRAFSAAYRSLLAAGRLASTVLVRPYHFLARTGFFRAFVPAGKKPRVVSFNRAGTVESRVLMGDRVVGRLTPRDKSWVIYPPYKLFIDEASLSVNATGAESEKTH